MSFIFISSSSGPGGMEPDGVIEVGSFGVLPRREAIQYYQCNSQTGFCMLPSRWLFSTMETGIPGQKASVWPDWVAHHWFTQMVTILLQLTCQFTVCLYSRLTALQWWKILMTWTWRRIFSEEFMLMVLRSLRLFSRELLSRVSRVRQHSEIIL